MQLNRRFLVVMALSLVWGLIVAGVFYKLAGASSGRKQSQAQKPVVVAGKPVPAGSILVRDSLKIRQVPENLFPAGGFSSIEEVLDRPVINAIQADEPVVEARIAPKGSGQGLGPLIPPGMRALSVRVNDVAGVAGFVLPGMRVDVLVTGKPPGREDTQTRTVLQNITVLSAGQTIQTDGKNQPITTPVVTLLVNPAEAEALTLALSEGKIQLALRNSTDKDTVATGGRRLNDLYENSVAPPPSPTAPRVRPPRVARASAEPADAKPAPPAASVVQELEVIRGTVKKVEVFPRESNSQ